MQAPHGSLRIVRGWKHRMISHAGTIGACEYPYDQSCSKCKHGLYIPGQTFNLYGDPCGSCARHTRLTTDLIRAQNRRKPVSESYVGSTFSQGLYDARTKRIVRARSTCGSHGFGLYGTLKQPGIFM